MKKGIKRDMWVPLKEKEKRNKTKTKEAEQIDRRSAGRNFFFFL